MCCNMRTGFYVEILKSLRNSLDRRRRVVGFYGQGLNETKREQSAGCDGGHQRIRTGLSG